MTRRGTFWGLDLAPAARRSLGRVLDGAKKREKAGEREGARLAYERAAGIAARLAAWAPESTVREGFLARERECLAAARRIARGGAPGVRELSALPAADSSGRQPPSAARDQGAPYPCELLSAARIGWDEIAGLAEAREAIRMATLLLLATPPEGVRLCPPRAILLYGPPGNGKTLLAAAASRTLASAGGGTARFYDVRLPFVLSRYFGESSRIVSAIYRSARERAPSVIFVDELDALARSRDAEDSGAERRILSTFLSELDGMAGKGRASGVLTIGATNRPWDLDPAVLSRFEKKILVPLPDWEARRTILALHLPAPGLASAEILDRLAEETEGYSGRDLEALVKSAVEGMVSRKNGGLTDSLDKGPRDWGRVRIAVGPLEAEDFARARERLGARDARATLEPYQRWAKGRPEAGKGAP
ncbi:MAG: ATP-binding protein [Planctomycetes bacterium]|nr:ATP-binding protein [Planctomycetota bacterium]